MATTAIRPQQLSEAELASLRAIAAGRRARSGSYVDRLLAAGYVERAAAGFVIDADRTLVPPPTAKIRLPAGQQP